MIEEKEQIEEVKELPEADEQKRSFKRGIRAGIAVGVAIILVLMLIITVAVRNHYMVSFINKKAADSTGCLRCRVGIEDQRAVRTVSICIIIKTPTRRI